MEKPADLSQCKYFGLCVYPRTLDLIGHEDGSLLPIKQALIYFVYPDPKPGTLARSYYFNTDRVTER